MKEYLISRFMYLIHCLLAPVYLGLALVLKKLSLEDRTRSLIPPTAPDSGRQQVRTLPWMT
ncbi:MAG: hypothetical protein EA400_02750 [Chromatiaceae bacterium]|nr:MAG: hypothetical protein EA400_02750 [Chromatiaceae bacterium]